MKFGRILKHQEAAVSEEEGGHNKREQWCREWGLNILWKFKHIPNVFDKDEMFKLESHWTEENVVNRETVSNMIEIQIKKKIVDL